MEYYRSTIKLQKSRDEDDEVLMEKGEEEDFLEELASWGKLANDPANQGKGDGRGHEFKWNGSSLPKDGIHLQLNAALLLTCW